MKVVKLVLLAGITGTLTSISVFAVPLDITLTGGTVSHDWGTGFPIFAYGTYQFEDVIDFSQPAVINVAGVNSINVTWNAPAGYMYVVNPPPAAIGTLGLQFQIAYGVGGQVSSLGSITASSLSAHTIYGNPSWGYYYNLVPFIDPQVPALLIGAGAEDAPDTAPFAFNSITVSLDFSKTGKSTPYESTELEPYNAYEVNNYGLLGGLFVQFPSTYQGPPDPGQLLTLQPLPTASTSDGSPTFGLAGLGFAGLLLLRRRLLPVAKFPDVAQA